MNTAIQMMKAVPNYGEELTMDVEIGSASVNEGVPVADEDGQDTDSDTYN